MEIWFYKRDAEVGDWVYADGTTTPVTVVNKVKTIVGVCFYVNPEDNTQRLCIALESLTNGKWGLSSGNWSEGITLVDNPEYSVFDVPTLSNKTDRAEIAINESMYRDESSAGDKDGFKVWNENSIFGELGWQELTSRLDTYPEGTKLPWGLINTLKIIEHRNKILLDSNINLPLPRRIGEQSEMKTLIQLMQSVIDENDGQTEYNEFYYPAASLCNAYEPVVPSTETLAPCFKTGRWFLPSVGEMARIYWGNTHNAQQKATADGIFAPHIASGKFTALEKSWFWCSTEYEPTRAWTINLVSSNTSYIFKMYTGSVRAIAAF